MTREQAWMLLSIPLSLLVGAALGAVIGLLRAAKHRPSRKPAKEYAGPGSLGK